jgi:hypothetical protein
MYFNAATLGIALHDHRFITVTGKERLVVVSVSRLMVS